MDIVPRLHQEVYPLLYLPQHLELVALVLVPTTCLVKQLYDETVQPVDLILAAPSDLLQGFHGRDGLVLLLLFLLDNNPLSVFPIFFLRALIIGNLFLFQLHVGIQVGLLVQKLEFRRLQQLNILVHSIELGLFLVYLVLH